MAKCERKCSFASLYVSLRYFLKEKKERLILEEEKNKNIMYINGNYVHWNAVSFLIFFFFVLFISFLLKTIFAGRTRLKKCFGWIYIFVFYENWPHLLYIIFYTGTYDIELFSLSHVSYYFSFFYILVIVEGFPVYC